jgi:hypothetical protein
MLQKYLLCALLHKVCSDIIYIFFVRSNGKHPATSQAREKIDQRMKTKRGEVKRGGGRVIRGGRIRRQRRSMGKMKKMNTEMNQKQKMTMRTCREMMVTIQREPQITFLLLLVLKILMLKMTWLGLCSFL